MSNVVFFFGYSCMIFFALAHPAAPALAFHNIVLGWFPRPGKQSGVDTERNDQKAELRSLAQFGAVPETGALWYPTSRPDISLRERWGGRSGGGGDVEQRFPASSGGLSVCVVSTAQDKGKACCETWCASVVSLSVLKTLSKEMIFQVFFLFFFTAENVCLCSIVAANRQMYLDYHSQCLNISCLQYCHLPFIQIYRTDREKTKNWQPCSIMYI